MMQKHTYEVEVTEINYGVVRVQAYSPEEAVQIAYEATADGDAIWGRTETHCKNPVEVM